VATEALIYVHCEGKTRLSTIRRPAVCHPKQLRAKQWSTLATRASTKRTKTEQKNVRGRERGCLSSPPVAAYAILRRSRALTW